jgi:type IV fimbrial biogenesis protein FimT
MLFKKISGMTWLEIMIVLMIMAVISHFSLPLWREQLILSQDRSLLLQLQTTLEFAQHQALLRRIPIGVCPTDDGLQCARGWHRDLLVFELVHQDATIEVIKHIRLSVKHGQLFWRAYPRYRDYLLIPFNPLKQNDNGTLWHCHDDAVQWAITFNQAGLARVVYPNADGQLPGVPGKPLRC